jgi:hypothetical protein
MLEEGLQVNACFALDPRVVLTAHVSKGGDVKLLKDAFLDDWFHQLDHLPDAKSFNMWLVRQTFV